MDNQYSLNNMYDLALPGQPALWPPANELWWLLMLLLLMFVIIIYHWRQSRKRNAYRLAGLALLETASTVHDVSVVLKRVALAAYPREQVASLYGEQWAEFLQRSYKRRNFSIITGSEPGQPVDRKVLKLAASWIQHHRVPATMKN